MSARTRLIAVAGLAAILVVAAPMGASAAETCVDSTTPTAATQPWADFSENPNAYLPFEPAFIEFSFSTLVLANSITATTSQVEFDAIKNQFQINGAATSAVGDAIGVTLEAQNDALDLALTAIDPALVVAAGTVFDGFSAELTASQYGAPLNTAYINYLDAVGNYFSAVQAAITAATPVPLASATSLSDLENTAVVAVTGFADFVDVVVYDGAADQVVYVQTCTAALAVTGSSDNTPSALIGGSVLLLGAALLVTRRRVSVRG